MKRQKRFLTFFILIFILVSLSFNAYTREYPTRSYPKSDKSGSDFSQIPRYPHSVRTEILDERNISCSYTIYYLSKDDFSKIEKFYSSCLPQQGWQIVSKDNYTDDKGKITGVYMQFSKETLKLYVCIDTIPAEEFKEKIKASQIQITLMETNPPWKLKDEEFLSTSAKFAKIKPAAAPKLSKQSKILSHYKLWKDSTENAFYGYIPYGWVAEGGIERPYIDASFQFEARGDKEGMIKIFFHIPKPLAYIEPTNMPFYETSEGDWYNVPFTNFRYYVLRYLSAEEYIRNQILPKLGSGAQIVKLTNREDLDKQYQGFLQFQKIDAADALVTFKKNGIPIKAGYTVISMGVSLPPTPTIWTVFIMGCQAPSDRFEKVEKLYRSILPTFKANPQWLKAEIDGQRQRQAMINGFFQRIMDADYRMWQKEQTSRIGIARGWMNALGGTSEYKNPETGETMILPDEPGINTYWQRGTDIIGTATDTMPDINYTRLVPTGR